MSVIRHALLLLSVASVAAAATANPSATLKEAEFAFFNGGFVDYRLGPVPVAASTGGAEESSVGGNDGSKGTHYGDPTDGCMKDEHPFQIQGVDGMICAPKCTAFRPCPSDLPEGVTASPQCALKSPDGNTYCALICSPDGRGDTNGFMLRASNNAGEGGAGGGECGAATCQAIGGAGICTYSD